GKYVTEQVYIMMTANDDVEAPSELAQLHTYLTHTLLVRIIVLVYIMMTANDDVEEPSDFEKIRAEVSW
ncbi:hypothetical protein V535_01971, partial [Staphylococcus aureus F19955]